MQAACTGEVPPTGKKLLDLPWHLTGYLQRAEEGVECPQRPAAPSDKGLETETGPEAGGWAQGPAAPS